MGPFAIATPEPLATAAGERAFRAGGTAVDAALAAAAVLTVTFPHNCALGGDAFILVRDPGGATTAINASGPAGRAADAEALRRRGDTMPEQAPETVTVPGVVAGWERLHACGAALCWRELLGDAIRLAADGFEVGASLAGAIAEDAAGIDADPGLRGVFAGVREGDRLRQPALAATLRELAAGGARVLYDGALGERLAAGLQRAGCTIDAGDLRGFEAETSAPAQASFRGLDVLTTPPNSQGMVLLQALSELGDDDDPGRLAELLRQAAHRRDAELGDRAGGPVSARGDTIALAAVDGEGRAVSLIQSLYYAFGALLLEPRTGIVVHNRGALFSLEPGHPNELAPGRRPAHTLMPVMVEQDGELRYVLGAMGGRGQPQIVAQVLLALLAGATAREAVAAPRWIAGAVETGDRDDAVRVEAGLPEQTIAALSRAGLEPLPVARDADVFGHAMAIALRAGARPDAGIDPRAASAG